MEGEAKAASETKRFAPWGGIANNGMGDRDERLIGTLAMNGTIRVY